MFFSQWKIKGLVPTNAHFPVGRAIAGRVLLCPRTRRLEQLEWLEQLERLEWLEQLEHRAGAAAALKGRVLLLLFFFLLPPVSFDLSLARGSAQGTLFDPLHVPFLQACLNLRNWGFLVNQSQV